MAHNAHPIRDWTDVHESHPFLRGIWGTAPPVSLVIPAPKVVVFIFCDAIVHTESIGKGGKGAILLVVHHISFLFNSGEVSASSPVMFILSTGCVKGGSIVGSRA